MRIALTFMTDNIPTLSIGWYQFSHIELNDTVSGVCMCTHSERMPQRCVYVEVRGQLGGVHFHLPVH